MIRVREQRLWTAVIIIGLCGFAISEAAPTLRFGVAAISTDPRMVDSGLKPFMVEEPIGPLARQMALAIAPPSDPAAYAAALRGLLGATPLSGGAWLDLAMAQKRSGAPLQNVASFLALSSLTAPNEARLMAGRAIFGLSFWAELPPDIHHTLIGDLIGGWIEINAAERDELNSLLTVETGETREEIRAALLLAGEPGAPVISSLGLTPETIDSSKDNEAVSAEPHLGSD